MGVPTMSRIIRTCFTALLTIIGWLSAESPETLQHAAYEAYGNQNADALYQALGKEAQLQAGIPPQECLAIKKFDPTAYGSIEFDPYKRHAALSSNGAIFVQQEVCEQIKTTGFTRITLFHEVIHVLQFKQHGCFKVINNQYSSIEKEADLESATLAHCWRCTQEKADRAYDANDTSEPAQQNQKDGYATKQELLAIAERQKHNHALCTYHKKSAIN